MAVDDCTHELLEVVACLVLGELPLLLDLVEELAALCVLCYV